MEKFGHCHILQPNNKRSGQGNKKLNALQELDHDYYHDVLLQLRLASVGFSAKYPRAAYSAHNFESMKDKPKTKGLNEKQVLELLKTILPKTTSDLNLAGKIIEAFEEEFKLKSQTSAFEKFLEKCELPDLEPATVNEVKTQLSAAFGPANVKIDVDKKEKVLDVEFKAGKTTFNGQIKVKPVTEESDEQEIKLKFVPFPVCLPADLELVWLLAKQENLTNEEAGISLAKIEEDFWLSKAGQKAIRDRVEKSFPEFIARVPAALLKEVNLKRHYKEPETIKAIHSISK